MGISKIDLEALIHEKADEIVDFLKQKQDEKNVTNNDLMFITRIPQTSFYRIWNKESKKPNTDHITRLCLALGVSIDEFQRTPTEDSVIRLPIKEEAHEEIMTNMLEEYTRQKDMIEKLQETLQEKDNTIRELESSLATKCSEMIQIQLSLNERINKLTDSLLERHDRMHEINKQHNDRVDKLDTALRERYDQLYKFFTAIIENNPQIITELAKKIH